jgi:hypothetical protein
MENTSLMDAVAHEFCHSCYTKVNSDDAFCDKCGYPLKGTPTEQQRSIADRTTNEIDHDKYKKSIKISATALYLVAASCVITGILQYGSDQDEELKFYVLLINLVVAFAFVALGAWVPKKPLPAILIGSVLYFSILTLNMIYDPLTLKQNFLIKIAIVIVLIRGIASAAGIEKVKKELNIR